ncbi:hypothetical protein EVJ58_g10937, partial [Rhodofomes roseus]
APEHAYDPVFFAEVPTAERVRLTRGLIVDLALMSGLWPEDGYVVPGATVCAAGLNACELAVIGLGWERAFGFDDAKEHPTGEVDHARMRWVPLGPQTTRWKGFELPFHKGIV